MAGMAEFPAGVGMNRACPVKRCIPVRVPRGCGDEPGLRPKGDQKNESSPRVWG